jgi:hypothetical protein
MSNTRLKQAQRYLYLKQLYDLSENNRLAYFPFAEIGEHLGWDVQTSDEISEYLKNEGLIEYPSFGTVSITHKGVKEIEAALSDPDQSTPYFPPAGVIIVVNGDFTIGGDVVGRDKTSTGVGSREEITQSINEDSVVIYPYKNPPYNAAELHFFGAEPMRDLQVTLIYTDPGGELRRKQVEEFFPQQDSTMIWRYFKANVLKENDLIRFRLLQRKSVIDNKVTVEVKGVGAKSNKPFILTQEFELEL